VLGFTAAERNGTQRNTTQHNEKHHISITHQELTHQRPPSRDTTTQRNARSNPSMRAYLNEHTHNMRIHRLGLHERHAIQNEARVVLVRVACAQRKIVGDGHQRTCRQHGSESRTPVGDATTTATGMVTTTSCRGLCLPARMCTRGRSHGGRGLGRGVRREARPSTGLGRNEAVKLRLGGEVRVTELQVLVSRHRQHSKHLAASAEHLLAKQNVRDGAQGTVDEAGVGTSNGALHMSGEQVDRPGCQHQAWHHVSVDECHDSRDVKHKVKHGAWVEGGARTLTLKPERVPVVVHRSPFVVHKRSRTGPQHQSNQTVYLPHTHTVGNRTQPTHLSESLSTLKWDSSTLAASTTGLEWYCASGAHNRSVVLVSALCRRVLVMRAISSSPKYADWSASSWSNSKEHADWASSCAMPHASPAKLLPCFKLAGDGTECPVARRSTAKSARVTASMNLPHQPPHNPTRPTKQSATPTHRQETTSTGRTSHTGRIIRGMSPSNKNVNKHTHTKETTAANPVLSHTARTLAIERAHQ